VSVLILSVEHTTRVGAWTICHHWASKEGGALQLLLCAVSLCVPKKNGGRSFDIWQSQANVEELATRSVPDSRLVERIPNSVSRLRSAVDWLQVLQLRPRRNSPQQLSNMRRQEEAAFLLFSILCEFFSSAVKPLSLRG